jgi:signal peptidase I
MVHATLAGLDAAEPADVGFASQSRAGAHAVRILNNTMAPALQRGDIVWVVPTRSYTSEGLYVFDRFGTPDVSRAEALGSDVIYVTKDAPDYLPHVMTRAEFEAVVIGRVVASSPIDERTDG